MSEQQGQSQGAAGVAEAEQAAARASAAAEAEQAAAKANAAADAARQPGSQAPAAPGPASSLARLTELSYQELKARERELQNQREVLIDRRSNVAGQYEAATGVAKDGVADRLRVMDDHLVRIERDLSAVNEQLVNTVVVQPQRPQVIYTGWDEGEVFGAVFTTFLATALMTVFIMRRILPRRLGFAKAAPAAAQSNERLDRIEQAVDTIAVEIERVSENQRFMTRLMTETQLGATLAAVRSSTEMAKSAAAEDA